MKHLAIVISILCLLSFPVIAPAQDSSAEFTIDKAETALYGELAAAEPAYESGVHEALVLDGQSLLGVMLTITPTWTEEKDRVEVDEENIILKTDSGQNAPMVGYFERYGEFDISTSRFSEWRSYDWQENKRPIYWNAVFAIPNGTKTAELSFGGKVLNLDVPESASKAPSPADLVKIEILESRYVDEIRGQYSVGDLDPKPVTVTTGGENLLLEVRFQISPSMGNDESHENFFWYTPWFGVFTDTGLYVPTLGEVFFDRLNDNVSHTLSRTSEGKISPAEATLYYAVPKGTSVFKLTYLLSPVATGQVTPPEPAGEKEPPSPETPKTDKEKAKQLLKDILKQTQ